MTNNELRDIRVNPQDLQMAGTAVTFGLLYTARVYAPLAEALLNPRLFLNVADRLGAGDSIRLMYTDKGNRSTIQVHEVVDLVVRGFAEREPRTFQIGPIFRMSDDARPDEKLTVLPTQPAPAEADPRTGLTIVSRETGQGRGRPKLISWDVYDGVGAIVFSDNSKEVAESFVRSHGAPAV